MCVYIYILCCVCIYIVDLKQISWVPTAHNTTLFWLINHNLAWNNPGVFPPSRSPFSKTPNQDQIFSLKPTAISYTNIIFSRENKNPIPENIHDGWDNKKRESAEEVFRGRLSLWALIPLEFGDCTPPTRTLSLFLLLHLI